MLNILNIKEHKPMSIWSSLIILAIITFAAQIDFFIIHYKINDLLDSLVKSSLKSEMIHTVILLPIISFFIIQLVSYVFFVLWTGFTTISFRDLFHLSENKNFLISLVLWSLNCLFILTLNNYFYPHSFFSDLIPIYPFLMVLSACLFFIMAFLAYYNFFKYKKQRIWGVFFIAVLSIFIAASIHTTIISHKNFYTVDHNKKPNIIFIGLDSVRPDYISYFNPSFIKTPHIDEFYKSSSIFTNAYTPLARTFTSWMSILTAQYPKHSNARSNLSNPDLIHINETLATRLQTEGYETIYGTDEKRFSNITKKYGFDKLIGPAMGVNDFVLGGLNDFPLTNLLINSSLGRTLFPFNFANRAAAVTYQPDQFLKLIELSLMNRSHEKPLFLAVHLCVSHWPFTWAKDNQNNQTSFPDRYKLSVEAVDNQLGKLMKLLKKNGLLENSLVILLSDHGTTVGLLGDRFIEDKNYLGISERKKWLPIFKLNDGNFVLNTAYGQGTDILSLKQYHILLAFRGYGVPIASHQNNMMTSLLDIAPTVLDFLHLEPLKNSDGISLYHALILAHAVTNTPRPLFLETGYCISEITKPDIFVDKVIQNAIGAYSIDSKSGRLFLKREAEQSINQSKERGVLFGDWLLARYPAIMHTKLVPASSTHAAFSNLILEKYLSPPFYVIANLKSGQWGIGLDSPLAKKAPMKKLMHELEAFYADEIKS